jgi:predicted DNA-binding transcriptional regulator YafY
MRRADRLFILVKEMRARRMCRAEDLAALLEVSVRTIYRDIAHLQAAGLPIDGEAGVGYRLRPGFDLPTVTFTHEQVDALAVGLSFAESLDDPALAAAAREVRAKIQANMPNPEVRKLSGAPYLSLPQRTGAVDRLGLLRQAIGNRLIVRLIYQDGEGRQTDRSVRPIAIWALPEGWMFSGWCELRHGFRTFRFDRIAQLVLTDDVFIADEDKGLRAFLEHERSVKRGCETAVGARP